MDRFSWNLAGWRILTLGRTHQILDTINRPLDDATTSFWRTFGHERNSIQYLRSASRKQCRGTERCIFAIAHNFITSFVEVFALWVPFFLVSSCFKKPIGLKVKRILCSAYMRLLSLKSSIPLVLSNPNLQLTWYFPLSRGLLFWR